MTLPSYRHGFPNDRPRATILLVEDEPFVREATCSILQNAGFEVLPAEDGHDAMTVYEEREWAIDLVITDMVLPGRTGEQLAEDLRQRSPELMVLITSGYGNLDYDAFEDDHQSNQVAGKSRTYFLAKPYSRKTLIDKIEQMLGTGAVALSRPAKQAG
ncbi:MAG: response regulator [Terriglobales bacterium]